VILVLRNGKIINVVFDGLFFRHFFQKIPIAIGTRNEGYAILPDGQTGIFLRKLTKKFTRQNSTFINFPFLKSFHITIMVKNLGFKKYKKAFLYQKKLH